MSKTATRGIIVASGMGTLLLVGSVFAGDPLPSEGEGLTATPRGVAPLAGLAAFVPKDADDSRDYAWSVRLSAPKVVWEIVGKERPKIEWTKIEAEVEMVTMDIAMGYSEATQLSERSQNRVVDLGGKRLDREEAMKRLEEDTPVMVSVSGEMPDPFYLRCMKPGTLVILIGLPSAREYDLLPRPRDTDRGASPTGDDPPTDRPEAD
ncbi:hypothetical protein HAHE_08790 [Haloferula helveola]|uniref:Uncharacterized protein n=1 Tax=Haloferula helveola TaxID=490095 RepID=A0ABN6H0I5_9BACT|nr:hypothetical protein HAHE_08790 [Haloferula helveola]